MRSPLAIIGLAVISSLIVAGQEQRGASSNAVAETEDIASPEPAIPNLLCPIGVCKIGGYNFGAAWQYRRCPPDGPWKAHTGADLHANPNTPVVAAETGIVKKIYDAGTGWAKAILVEHTISNYKFVTQYMHVDPKAGLTPGMQVSRGDAIATVAKISLPHLHFGVWNGAYGASAGFRGALPNCKSPTTSCYDGIRTDPCFPQLWVDPMPFLGAPQVFSRAVVSTSLRLSPSTALYATGQPINGTFSVTNRGTSNLFMKRVVIGGRLAGTCPNNQCPDFGPVGGDITLAPNQSYNYAGSFTPSAAGTYTFAVAYEDAAGKWTMPVEAENNNTNRLNITVQAVAPRVVVTKSLTVTPTPSPYRLGQTLTGSFSITNRGNTNISMRQVLIGGRLGDSCPNNICPDFSPIRTNISLAPGQTYNYSGQINLSQSGTYTFYVAYETPDAKWEMPVRSENGAVNKLTVLVQPPMPTLSRVSPSPIVASPNPQTVNVYGSRLAKVIYGELRSPNGSISYLYLPLNQLLRVTDDQTRITTRFPFRGTYYVTVWTAEGKSNQYPIVVN